MSDFRILCSKVFTLDELRMDESPSGSEQSSDTEEESISITNHTKSKLVSVEPQMNANLKPPLAHQVPFWQEVKLLEESKSEPVEEYCFANYTISSCGNKEDIKSYVNESLATGKPENRQRRMPPRDGRPSLFGKAKLCKEIERDASGSELSRKCDVPTSTIACFISNKEKRRDNVNSNSKRPLEQTSLPIMMKKPRNLLPFHKKVELLERLDEGKSLSEVAKMYDVHERTVRKTSNRKSEIITYVNESIDNNEEDNVNRRSFPAVRRKSCRVLTLRKKIQVLALLQKGTGISELAEKYGVSTMTIRSIKSRKNEILRYVIKTVKNGEEVDLDRKALPPVMDGR